MPDLELPASIRDELHAACEAHRKRFSPTRHVLMTIYTGIRLPLVVIAVCGAATGPQLPDDQIAVCKAFNQGAAEFYPLQQNWKKSDQESNGVARTVSQDGLKQKIDTLFRGSQFAALRQAEGLDWKIGSSGSRGARLR